FAGPKLLAKIAAANRNRFESLWPVFLDKAYTAELFEKRRESDFHWLDQQFALKFIEFALGGEAVPNVGAVVIRGVRMFAANNDTRETVVLPVDGVHYRLFRSGIKHFDVQAN